MSKNYVNPDPFTRYSGEIVSAACELYHAERTGTEPDPMASRVALPQNIGDASPEAMRNALRAEAEVNVAAKAVARLAMLGDQRDRGGISGKLAGFEIRLTSLFDRRYIRGALLPGGPVDRVRSSGN